jgi:hypothetical protein
MTKSGVVFEFAFVVKFPGNSFWYMCTKSSFVPPVTPERDDMRRPRHVDTVLPNRGKIPLGFAVLRRRPTLRMTFLFLNMGLTIPPDESLCWMYFQNHVALVVLPGHELVLVAGPRFIRETIFCNMCRVSGLNKRPLIIPWNQHVPPC